MDKLEIINPGILHFDITPEKLTFPHELKPWNPIIASVFYRAGIIEKWGTGTLNIIEWCKNNGNPKPTWEIRNASIISTFLPSGFYVSGKRPESLEEAVLNLLEKEALSKSEIAKNLGHKNISSGLNKIIRHLITQKQIAYSIPEKPNSRLQKYLLKK